MTTEQQQMTEPQELKQWRKLAMARGAILVAYRIGGRTPAKAIDDAMAAEAALRAAGKFE